MAELLMNSNSNLNDEPISRMAGESVLQSDSTTKLLQQFLQPTHKTFNTQYNQIYLRRLHMLHEPFVKNLQALFLAEGLTEIVIADRLVDAVIDEPIVIVGTLFKDMPEKPNILDELEKDPELLVNHLSRSNFCGPKDILYLEDDFGRVSIVFTDDATSPGFKWPMSVDNLVSGLIVALYGTLSDSGDFIATRAFFPGSLEANITEPTESMSSLPEKKDNTDEFTKLTSSIVAKVTSGEMKEMEDDAATPENYDYIAFVSGLQVGKTSPTVINLLFDYLTGICGSTIDQHCVSHVSKVVFAGNSLVEPPRPKGYAERGAHKGTDINHVMTFDRYLSQAAMSLPTVVLPGESDPANFLWPQHALHGCLFPLSDSLNTFQRTTNPAWVTHHSQKNILVTDGKNISDICRFSLLSPIDALESTLRWNIVAPTAPDTLGSYPYVDFDPYVLSTVPDIYIVGSQNEFKKTLVTCGTNVHHGDNNDNKEKNIDKSVMSDDNTVNSMKQSLLITLPSFEKTNQVVLVNPTTFHTIVLTIPTF